MILGLRLAGARNGRVANGSPRRYEYRSARPRPTDRVKDGICRWCARSTATSRRQSHLDPRAAPEGHDRPAKKRINESLFESGLGPKFRVPPEPARGRLAPPSCPAPARPRSGRVCVQGWLAKRAATENGEHATPHAHHRHAGDGDFQRVCARSPMGHRHQPRDKRPLTWWGRRHSNASCSTARPCHRGRRRERFFTGKPLRRGPSKSRPAVARDTPNCNVPPKTVATSDHSNGE